MTPLHVGAVTPKGWLLKQLTIQAEGLTGHLSDFWPDVMSSVWIGGANDTGLHERTPYWLNGLVPLSFLLENAGAAPSLNSTKNITQQVESYIQYILAHQAADGWFGPKDDADAFPDGNMYWGPSNVLQSLYQYAEGVSKGDRTHPVFVSISAAIVKHLVRQKEYMLTTPQGGWAQARWQDISLTIQWVIDNNVAGEHEADLMALLTVLQTTGSDWENWFETFHDNGRGANGHNVNNAQAIKTSGVIYRYNSTYKYKNYTMEEASVRRMHNLDTIYGLPTGMFNGDEYLPTPATRSPSRGIELCGVVEAMFSYTVLYSVFPQHIEFADRTELIAYNALPATWASPRGGDMWAHQYLQAVNEVNAVNATPRVWQTDGSMSETYGLAPNYGCCTANFNQGWPKFASNLYFTGTDGALVVGMYAPSSAVFPGGHSISIDTTYPFEDTVTITVTPKSTVKVQLRIPKWAVKATVNGQKVANGTYHTATVSAETVFTLDFNSELYTQEWDDGAVSVHKGALMYSLPIAPSYQIYATHFGTNMSNDYYLNPTSQWGFALDIGTLNWSSSGYHAGSAPWNHTGWPNYVTASVRAVNWTMEKNSAANPPVSPACTQPGACGPSLSMKLVPHGGTELRIGEFPNSGL